MTTIKLYFKTFFNLINFHVFGDLLNYHTIEIDNNLPIYGTAKDTKILLKLHEDLYFNIETLIYQMIYLFRQTIGCYEHSNLIHNYYLIIFETFNGEIVKKLIQNDNYLQYIDEFKSCIE